MTTIVLTRGSNWSSAELYDGWGDCTDAEASGLGDLVVERFQELAANHDSSAYWTPRTREVIGHIDDNATDDELNGWREQAFGEVWEAVVDGDGPMVARVNEIFS